MIFCYRLFIYNIKTNDIYLKVSTKCVDRCILKMYILSHKSKVIVLIMTTDGILRFFNFTKTVLKIHKDVNIGKDHKIDFNDNPIAQFRLHQSGINSFDLKHMDEDKYLLATGGDDNLLCLLCFQLRILENNALSVETLSNWTTTSAHSAQITGKNLSELYILYIFHKTFYSNIKID